jgi:hypothetical protein
VVVVTFLALSVKCKQINFLFRKKTVNSFVIRMLTIDRADFRLAYGIVYEGV